MTTLGSTNDSVRVPLAVVLRRAATAEMTRLLTIRSTWWALLTVPLQRSREAVKEPVLLHVCSFYQYIYGAVELDTVVASSLSRVVVIPLRKSVSRTRRTLPHEASL